MKRVKFMVIVHYSKYFVFVTRPLCYRYYDRYRYNNGYSNYNRYRYNNRDLYRYYDRCRYKNRYRYYDRYS